MKYSLKHTIKKILKEEDVPSETDERISDIMADISLADNAIEKTLAKMGINMDLSSIASFGSIDKLKAIGKFDLSFLLKKESPFFGSKRDINGVSKYSKKSTEDTLVLDFIDSKTGNVYELTFERNSLVKDIPMSASAEYKSNIWGDSKSLKNKKVMSAPGLVEDGVYVVKFSLIKLNKISFTTKETIKYTTNKGEEIPVEIMKDQSDVQKGYILVKQVGGKSFAVKKEKLVKGFKDLSDIQRIKIKDLGFIKKGKDSKTTPGNLEISNEPIRVNGKIENFKTKKGNETLWDSNRTISDIEKGLSSGNAIIRWAEDDRSRYWISLPNKHKSYIVVKPKGGGDFDRIIKWESGVDVIISPKPTDRDLGNASAKIKLNVSK